MPHLSPMNWMIAPIMFALLSLPIIMSALWWSQTPNFPLLTQNFSMKQSMWNWN